MTRTLFRLRIVGIVLAMAGLTVATAGLAYGVPTATNGLESAQAMYKTQGVKLNYNEEGDLVDRGTVEGAQAIMALLRDDWKYPVDASNFDPNDPIINTRDELMYQYATITYHVLHDKQAVTLTEAQVPITHRGVTYSEPGTYDIEVGAYYAQLDRTHPIEGQLRGAWSPLALSLTSLLAAGHANQAAGELAMLTSIGVGSIGLLFAVAGAGLIWVTWGANLSRAPAISRKISRPGRERVAPSRRREQPMEVPHGNSR